MAADRPRDAIPADEVQGIIAAAVAAELEKQESLRATEIQAEVAKQLAGFKDSLSASASHGPSPGNGDQSWMEALAMAIAGVTDQEIGRRRIPPEEVKKRAAAFGKLNALLEETQKAGVQPTYFLRKQVYLGEMTISPIWIDRATKQARPTEIGWWGIPNQFMEPINEPAGAIMALFLEWIGDAKKAAPIRVTAGGLVVRSGGMPVEGGRDSAAASAVGRDIYKPVVKRNGAQTQEITTRILGTLMEPARQMVG